MKKGVDLEQVKVKTWFEENHRVEGPNVISARLVFFVLLSESSQSSFWWSIKLLTCRACSTCNNYFCKYLKYCPAVKRIFFLFFLFGFEPPCTHLSSPRCLICSLSLRDVQWTVGLVVVRISWPGHLRKLKKNIFVPWIKISSYNNFFVLG
jgi:hypothetical protein